MLTERFQEALIFATQLHAKQVRKGSGVPYVAHLLGAASTVLEYGGNEDEAIAALLHDAIEDQGGAATRAKIRDRFGDSVTAIVDGCTDADTVPKPPWRERKTAFIASLASASPSVKLVVTADKLYNARSILKDYRALGNNLWQRFTGKKEGTLWYYQSLVKVLIKDESNDLAKELERVVIELNSLVDSSAVR